MGAMSKAMTYELTGSTKVKDVKGAKKWHISKELEDVSTGRILFYLVMRHKYQILTVWATYLTLQWMYPPFTDTLVSVIQSVL